MKGQISAEMILLLVVLLAVVALVASSLLDSSKSAGEKVTASSDRITEGLGTVCVNDGQCREEFGPDATCDAGHCVCDDETCQPAS